MSRRYNHAWSRNWFEFTVKLLGMEIEPEKELVMILMPSDLIDKVVDDLFQELQLDIPGNGILFVEPIMEVRVF